MGSDRWEEWELQAAYLEEVSPQVGPETALALKLGDITKPYAQAMEGLGGGRGTLRHRDRRGRWHTGVLHDGHWGFPWQRAPSWPVVVHGVEEDPL